MDEELFQTVYDEVKSHFEDAHATHDFDHTLRVHNLCAHIGRIEKADLEILNYSSILHDIGRKHQDETKGEVCHAEVGAKIAEDLLKKHDFDSDKIKKIIHCIETHRSKGSKIPDSKEAKILFDADKLDGIGAVGIGRAFMFASMVGAKLHNEKGVDIEKTKAYSEEDTAYREFMVSLRKTKDKMFTTEGKRLAKERHEFMVEYFDRLKKEIEGEL